VTPAATKIAIVATLVLTGTALAAVELQQRHGLLSRDDIAPILWLLTALFVLRVAGQVFVAVRAPAWLPAMGEWNLTPYRLLLPTQVIILAVMVWIDISFSSSAGPATERAERFGWALITFSAAYAGVMVIRYVVRMYRRAAARWFGGTIPIVFHIVLATYLFGLGSFHAGR
jgi:hypothetical protein